MTRRPTRRLDFQPLDTFVVDGELRALREPGALPTTRQWSMLNRLGCIVIVEPRSADPLTRADAAGAIAAALRADPGAPVSDGHRRDPARSHFSLSWGEEP